MGLVLIYFAVRGIIYINNYGFNEIFPSKKLARRISIYLSSLFVLSFFVIMNELINEYKDAENLNLWLVSIFTFAFVSTAYVLNKLLFTNTLHLILIRELPRFKLDEKNNPDAKKDFEKICRFFKSEYNLFEESANQLLDLISSNSKNPIIFNIRKDCEEDPKKRDTNRTLFFLFYRILKLKCIKTPNSLNVLLKRFKQDGQPLTPSDKSLKKQLSNLSTNVNNAIESISEKNLMIILSKMEKYHITFAKNSKESSLTKKYLENKRIKGNFNFR